MTATKKNAPDLSGNSVEGEDPNTQQGEQINMKTTPTVSDTTDIHPEIPRASWVTNRFVDEDGDLVDQHRYTDGRFTILRDKFHPITGADMEHPETVTIDWVNEYADGTDPQQVTALVRDIPEIIAVLQRTIEAGA